MSETRNSSLWGKITVILVICFFALSAQAKYGGGTGEPNDPYLIFTADQMNAIGADSNDWDKHFLLCADIDLSGFTGTSFNIIGTNWDNPFTGVFDGNGHTISNFSYASTGRNGIGLFGYVDDPNAEIKNLGLIAPNVDAGTAWAVGSLLGWLDFGTITNCYVDSGSTSGCFCVGGLVGWNGGPISNCYSTGSVAGNERVGGLVGFNAGDYGYYGEISNCYSTASVTGTGLVGGLVGYNECSVWASFWDIETSGQTTSAGGTGKTTAEMQTMSTFISWGCGSVWTIDEGKDYPKLLWENKHGEIIMNPSYGAGSGDPNDPYLIYTAEQLNTIGLIRCDWDKHFKLMGDIDLSAFTGTSFNIIGLGFPHNKPFTGVFDGSGHTISNFTYSTTAGYNSGLFGYVDDPNAQIKNLGLIDPNVDAGTGYSISIGSLVGYLENGDISNCYVEGGSVAGNYFVGGLVGKNNVGTISNCYSEGSVSGTTQVGGLVGDNENGTIMDCYSTGSVSGNYAVGGLVGHNWGTISNCYSTGSVSGDRSVGGLVGGNSGTITNCYSTGSATATAVVGGLVGFNYDTITDCYAIGSVSGTTNVGGLVGVNLGDISNSYSETSVSGTTGVGGLVGGNRRSYPWGGTGTITNCYSTGSVSGDNDVGGLVGRNHSYWTTAIVTQCYSTGSVTGENDVGGLVGINDGMVLVSFWDIETSGQPSSDGGTGKTTAEMQTQSTFTDAGWDFITPIWTIDEGVDYPRLWWELVPVLYAEPEVTLGTSNTIWWDPVVGAVEYYAECAEDANFTSILYNSGWITETSCEFTSLELGQKYWYSVKARNSAGTETGWSNVEFSLQVTLGDAVKIMLDTESLKNENMKNALLKKIDSVLKMIEEGLYEDALDKLRNDILAKMNGCVETGQPDKNDWIITCEEQSVLYPLVIETIEYVRGLMGE